MGGDDSAEQVVVTKTMSLSRSEFDKSLGAFKATTGYEDNSANALASPNSFAFDLPDGHAVITYKELASATYGGLLNLPRAEIRIAFEGADDAVRKAFIAAFDIAFQRGGG